MGKLFNDTKTNLLMGLRLVFFRPCGANQFAINSDQLVVLLMLDLCSDIAFEFLVALPEPVFDLYALPTYSFGQLVFFLLVFIISKLWKNPGIFLAMGVMTLSLTPFLNALIYWDYSLQRNVDGPGPHDYWWGLLVALYSLAALGRALYLALGRLKAPSAITLLAIIISSGLEYHYFGDSQKFWYPSDQGGQEEQDMLAEYRAMDAEQLMYRQPEILATALHTLKPQREHHSDLFFVGFASYAGEDVFSKEVTFAKGVLDVRFDTLGHSINLVNHLSTRDTVPLANGTNLAATLKYIGKLMDKNEDVLMVYLTSHGSEDHELSVSFWPLALNGITPEKLRTMLDDAGIKWRVILISACYSGGFIGALTNDQTLVATAAAADKTSFGCGTKSEFTYFGEAVFKDQLPHEHSIISALEQARTAIEQREKSADLTPSLPQLWVGKAIRTKLDSLSEGIRPRQCKPDANNGVC
ncbi:C13 family peptidase [Methylovulum miyakonense]|uniref:C13 family peptidase n=1 Tax=Methylovulum miyakonense TaxID=645578 RepID=UPI000367143C|nr:C13 family peptidase [Methylovulum miyakonense]